MISGDDDGMLLQLSPRAQFDTPALMFVLVWRVYFINIFGSNNCTNSVKVLLFEEKSRSFSTPSFFVSCEKKIAQKWMAMSGDAEVFFDER